MLEIRNLHAGYPGREVLHGVDMTAPAGRITAILGPNGCGKTTLLKTLCGILPANAGEILVEGLPVEAYSPRELARKVAYLAQNRDVPDITARRLVLHGRFPYLNYPRRYRAEDHAAAEAAMARMGICDLAEAPLKQLSGGQRQKVYLAMALAQATPIVLLDEPTTYLDVAQQLATMAHARMLCGEGKTVVTVLHDLTLAFGAADQVVLLEEGWVAAAGTPEAVFLSGSADRVFGVRLRRVKTDRSWHYYCEAE